MKVKETHSYETKRKQPRNNKIKDLLKMGYQASSEEVRSSYPGLHIKTLVGARNPCIHEITLQEY
jgi:hypothetical protein